MASENSKIQSLITFRRCISIESHIMFAFKFLTIVIFTNHAKTYNGSTVVTQNANFKFFINDRKTRCNAKSFDKVQM